MLSTIIFLPAIGAAVVAVLGRDVRVARAIALTVVVTEFLLSLVVFLGVRSGSGDYLFVERLDWIPSLGVQYFVGVDGLSGPLVLLNGLLGLSAVLVSWKVKERPNEYYGWLLLLQTSVMGVFLSLDLLVFFVFWELELIPMFFLISIWGTGRRDYSAMKFLLFTLLGSAFMLASIIVLYFSFPDGSRTFDATVIADRDLVGLILPTSLVFAGFFIAFAVKLPMFPLHTWLPDAHTDAPTAVSVMLAGVLLKMGGYGLIRFNAGIFPEQMREAGPFLAAFGIIGIVYGAFIVIRQTDLKRLVAYSSVSHMGFVLLGLSSVGAAANEFTPLGLNGAAMQLFTHGTITGLLFVVVGLIYDRVHTRYIPDLGGLVKRMPIIGIALVLAGLASLGLPATSGFVSEVLIFVGAFDVYPVVTGFAASGVVLAAAYILWMIQRTIFGRSSDRWDDVADANSVDVLAMAVLAIPIFVIGIYPRLLTDMFDSGLVRIASGFW